MCINNTKLSFKELDSIFGKTEGYWTSVRANSPTRYYFIMSFDTNKYFSVLKYMDYLNKLFHEASLYEMQLDSNTTNSILQEIGYKHIKSVYEFRTYINQIIDEESFLNIQFHRIVRIINFIDVCYARGIRINNGIFSNTTNS